MALYFALFEPLGYIVATTLFLLAFTCYLLRGKWIPNVVVSVIFPVTSYLLLDGLLGLALPRGSIF